MFSKFFTSGSKSNDKNVQPEPPPLPHSCSWEPVAFEASQLRVIVLKESSSQGRQALFDSLSWDRQSRKHNGIRRKSTPDRDPEIRRASSVGSQSSTSRNHCRLKRVGDMEMLAEMMFGSAAIVSHGSTVKLHRLRDPPRLLITKVFSWQKKRRRSSAMSPTEAPPTLGSSLSLPVNVSSPIPHTPSTQSLPSSPQDIPIPLSFKNTPFDPESMMSASPGNTFFSPTGSFLTRQRRSLVVSLEFATARMSLDDLFGSGCGKHGKLAIGVIISLPTGCTDEIAQKQRVVLDFFFSHFLFVESHIEQLRENVESVLDMASSNSQRNVIEQFAEVVSYFKSVIVSLCQSLRLNSPIWLSLMKSSVPRNMTCKRLIDMLNHAVTHYNIPTNKQFLTRLLTAVLSYHLGWVSTVVPSQSDRDNSYLNKHASNSYMTLAQSHPYNPLWAQLADLYGVIGSPPHTAQTVIVGRKSSVVYQLLYILSYFIRCTHIIEFDSSLESYWHLEDPEVEPEMDPEMHNHDTHVEENMSSVHESDFDSQLNELTAMPLMKSSDKDKVASVSSPDIGALGREKNDIISPACSTQSLASEMVTELKRGLVTPENSTKNVSVFSLDSGLGTEENGLVIKRQQLKEKRDEFKACSVSALSRSLKETDLFGMDSSQLVERFSELEDLELPPYNSEETDRTDGDEVSNGRPRSLSESLFGGFTDQYHPDFVLQGTGESLNDFMPRLSMDLELQLKHPGIDELLDEAVCIVADTDDWTCNIVSLKNQRPNSRHQRRGNCVNIQQAEKSALIQSLLDTLQEMHQHNMPDEFCLMQLEDKLQEIYYKSRVFSEHYRSDKYHELSKSKLAAAAGVDPSDLPLLQSVAQTEPTYSPSCPTLH